MPIKELRGEQDIGEMADELSRRWRQGDGVKPFLRSLEPELSRKVREERWSWESIAHALNRAGIRYRTGRPWTGVALLSKVTSIRHEAKRATARRPEVAPLPSSRPASPPVTDHATVSASGTGPEPHVQEPARPVPAEEAEGSFQFRPVKFRNPPPPRKAPSEPPPLPAAPVVDSETAIARMFGRPIPSKEEQS